MMILTICMQLLLTLEGREVTLQSTNIRPPVLIANRSLIQLCALNFDQFVVLCG